MKSLKFFGKPKKSRRWFVIRRVAGDSMLPTFRPGRIVIGIGRFKVLRASDVVIVWHGGLEKIKRVAQINGDQLYLLGDNQKQSTDSRAFGWLHISAVQAKIIWPGQHKTKKRS